MVLASKQTHRSIEHNTEPRNKSMQIWSTTIDKGAKTIQWGRIVPSINGDGKTRYHMQKNEIGPVLYYTQNSTQDGL